MCVDDSLVSHLYEPSFFGQFCVFPIHSTSLHSLSTFLLLIKNSIARATFVDCFSFIRWWRAICSRSQWHYCCCYNINVLAVELNIDLWILLLVHWHILEEKLLDYEHRIKAKVESPWNPCHPFSLIAPTWKFHQVYA